MHSDVDHRTAALKFLPAKNAPVGDAATAKCLGANIKNLAQGTGLNQIAQHFRARLEAMLEADDELDTIFVGGIGHRLRLNSIHRHWFLAENMLAGAQSALRLLSVEIGRRADDDRVDSRIGE